MIVDTFDFENSSKIETEKCVKCGKDTHIPIDLNIDMRENYVECVGQLCGSCFIEVYKGIK